MNQKQFVPVILVGIAGVILLTVGFFYLRFPKDSVITNPITSTQTQQPATTPIQGLAYSPSPKATSNDLNSQILKDIAAGGVNCDLTDANGNVTKDNCKVDKVVGNYAKGTMPQAYWMGQKTAGKWKVVVTGNGIPTCTEIDKYSIPKEIYGNCIETSGELRF